MDKGEEGVKGRDRGKGHCTRHMHLQERCVILFELYRQHNFVENVCLFRKLCASSVLSGLFFPCCVGGGVRFDKYGR